MTIVELGAAIKRYSSWLQGRQQPGRMKKREMTRKQNQLHGHVQSTASRLSSERPFWGQIRGWMISGNMTKDRWSRTKPTIHILSQGETMHIFNVSIKLCAELIQVGLIMFKQHITVTFCSNLHDFSNTPTYQGLMFSFFWKNETASGQLYRCLHFFNWWMHTSQKVQTIFKAIALEPLSMNSRISDFSPERSACQKIDDASSVPSHSIQMHQGTLWCWAKDGQGFHVTAI